MRPSRNCPPVNLSCAHTLIEAGLPCRNFLKIILFILLSNFQVSVNLVISHYRTEERLINVKPCVCHRAESNGSSLKAVLFLVLRNKSRTYAVLFKGFKEHDLQFKISLLIIFNRKIRQNEG